MISNLFRNNKIIGNEINENNLSFKEKYNAILTRIRLNSDGSRSSNISGNIRSLENQLSLTTDNLDASNPDMKYLSERNKNRESLRDMAYEPIFAVAGVLEGLSLYGRYTGKTTELGSNILEVGAIGAFALASACAYRKANSYVKNYLLHDKNELTVAQDKKDSVKIDISNYDLTGDEIKKSSYSKNVLSVISGTLLLGGIGSMSKIDVSIAVSTPSNPQVTKNIMPAITQRNRKDKQMIGVDIIDTTKYSNLEEITSELTISNSIKLDNSYELPIDKNKQFTQYAAQNVSFNIREAIKVPEAKIEKPLIESNNIVLDVLKFNLDNNTNFSDEERAKLWKVENRIEYALNALENENLNDFEVGEIYSQIETMKEKLLKKKKSQIKKDAFKIASIQCNKDKLIPTNQKLDKMTGYSNYLVSEVENGNFDSFSEVQENRVHRYDERIEKITNLENKILSKDFIVQRAA